MTVQADVLLGILGLEEEELCRDHVGQVVGDLGAEEDDALAQQAGVDVEGSLATAVRFHHHRDETVRVQLTGCTLSRNRRVAQRRCLVEVTRELGLPAAPDEVWEELTDPARLEEWFATEVELDLEEGEGHFRWENGERHAVVETVEEGRRLGYTLIDEEDARRRSTSRSRRSRRARASSSRRPRRSRSGGRRSSSARAPMPRQLDAGRSSALSDATRRTVVEALASRETATATELARKPPSRARRCRST